MQPNNETSSSEIELSCRKHYEMHNDSPSRKSHLGYLEKSNGILFKIKNCVLKLLKQILFLNMIYLNIFVYGKNKFKFWKILFVFLILEIH